MALPVPVGKGFRIKVSTDPRARGKDIVKLYNKDGDKIGEISYGRGFWRRPNLKSKFKEWLFEKLEADEGYGEIPEHVVFDEICDEIGRVMEQTEEPEEEREPVKTEKAGTLAGLHPAGGVTNEVVWEPVGLNAYAWRKSNGKKGVSEVNWETHTDEDTGEKWTVYWFEADGTNYRLKEAPPFFVFDLPRREVMEAWAEGEKKALSTQELFWTTTSYFMTFLDVPRQEEYPLMAEYVFQSWVLELLSSVFYGSVAAEIGGGKTATGEAVIMPCRHGLQTGDLSPAFVARLIDKQKGTIFIDELDAVADMSDPSDPLLTILRNGQRRGGTYSRQDSNDPDKSRVYDVFGPKFYTLQGESEAALGTRTLPFHTRETTQIEYPIINPLKRLYGLSLREEFTIWWLDNAIDMKKGEEFKALRMGVEWDDVSSGNLSVAPVAPVAPNTEGVVGGGGKGGTKNTTQEAVSSGNPQELMQKSEETSTRERNNMFRKRVGGLREGQLGQLRQLAPMLGSRNVEFAYELLALENFLGVNIDEYIFGSLKQKRIEELESAELGVRGLVRDELRKLWGGRRGDERYLTKDGYVKISNQETLKVINQRLRDEGLRGMGPSKFKKHLIEFKFTDGVNRRKAKIWLPSKEKKATRLCNIFTEPVLEKLGVEEEKEESLSQQKLMREIGLLYRRRAADFDSRKEFIERAKEKFPDEEPKRLEEAVNRGKDEHGWIFDDDFETVGGKNEKKDAVDAILEEGEPERLDLKKEEEGDSE